MQYYFRDEDNRTPLHMAAIYGRLSRSKSLIDNQAEVNTVDDKGQTPLHVAAAHGHEMLVGLLLSAGLYDLYYYRIRFNKAPILNRTSPSQFLCYKQLFMRFLCGNLGSKMHFEK